MNTPTTPTAPLDGQATSPDSAVSSSALATIPALPAIPAESAADEAHDRAGREALKCIGMTKAAARRLLAKGRPDKFLRIRITAAVNLAHEANSLEELQRAQRWANRMARDEKLEGRERVACLAVVAQCGVAIARLCEATLESAAKMDEPENLPPAPKTVVQNNVYNYPPVAKAPERRSLVSAKVGNEDVDVVEVPPKTS